MTKMNRSGAHWSASSLRGVERRRNSDAVAVADDGACHTFALADGVGALEASPRASKAAAHSATEWASGRTAIGEADAAGLVDAVDGAVREVVRDDRGATTLVFAAVEGNQGVVFTVGDSEVLAVDESGPARRLNPLDHVPAKPNMLLAWIDGKVDIEPHVIALDPLPFRLVLATDGVTGALDKESIAELVRAAPIERAARVLTDAARQKGAVDDASAIVIAPANGAMP
jgi:serine/threonine protein phosphatase PrpC